MHEGTDTHIQTSGSFSLQYQFLSQPWPCYIQDIDSGPLSGDDLNFLPQNDRSWKVTMFLYTSQSVNLLGLVCLRGGGGGKCLLAVCIFSLVAVRKSCSSALSSTRANRLSAVSFVSSRSLSPLLPVHICQIDLEVGQRWHVLFATIAVFHGGSCHFSVSFDLDSSSWFF